MVGDHESIFCCPVCKQTLVRLKAQYVCINQHGFDVAKSGYVNLLLANQRHTTDPGDGKSMVEARARFLEQGSFQLLAQHVVALVCEEAGRTLVGSILDIGCGTGYYLRQIKAQLANRLPAVELYGIDISRHAILAASRVDRAIRYAVASSFHMPVSDGLVDVLLAHFAQAPASEVRRVMKPEGLVIVGGPGPRHLFELRRLIYSKPVEHASKEPFLEESSLSLVSASRVQFPLVLTSPEAILSLLEMTPYYWSSSNEVRSRLNVLAELETEIDVVFHLYRRIA